MYILKNSCFILLFCSELLYGEGYNKSLYAQDLSVKAYFDRSTIVVNQSVMLNVELSGNDVNNASQPELPDFGGWFKFIGSSGSSQNLSWINGKFSGSITYSYILMPLKNGTATIPAITVKCGSKTVASQPITVEIKDAGAIPPPKQGTQQGASKTRDTPGIILVPVPNKKTIYQNEGITVEYKVYIEPSVNVTRYTELNVPNYQGFWKVEFVLPKTPHLYSETYQNREYNTAVLKRVELYPTQSGELELSPLEMEFTVVSNRQQTGNDFFDRFFNDPFFGGLGRSETVTIRSNPLRIAVKSLPNEGLPPEFNGAVGRFSITATADKHTVKENESVTLIVTIEGSGNIKFIPEPTLRLPDSFERYDPKVEDDINLQGTSITGKKTIEYVLVPRKKGTYAVAPITFAYFDPAAEQYISMKTQPIPITVEPGPEITGNMPRAVTREEVKLMGSDIRFIKESYIKWDKIGKRQFISLSFLSIIIIPFLMVCGAFVYSRHLQKLNADVALKRSRQANAVATKRLKKAQNYLQAGNTDAFYPEIASALQEYIADKLNIASAGIVTEELETHLLQMNIDDDLVEAYIACLKKCDFHRFSSAKGTLAEMNKLYEDSRTAIYEMEQRLKNAM
jgi:hypothetical protein